MIDDNSDQIAFFGSAGEYVELCGAILEATQSVLTTGQVLQGPAVEVLETRVAKLTGRRHAVAIGSGTDALYFALLAAGVGPGDEVLVPDVTFLATATAVVRTGAKPIFVDVDPSCGLDLEAAAGAISSATRCLLYVHLFGAMGDARAIESFAKAYNLKLIEDFAQCLGAERDGRCAGSLGMIGATSFDPTKVIGAPGSGGMVVTDDAEAAARVRRLRFHGKQGAEVVELGYNSQLPSWTAAILSLKLDRHEVWTRRRRQIAEFYSEAFRSLPIGAVPYSTGTEHVWHKFVVYADQRDALRDHLHHRGVPTRIHYDRPLHREIIFASNQIDAEFPSSIEHCSRAISLPIHSHLTDSQAEHVVRSLRCFFE